MASIRFFLKDAKNGTSQIFAAFQNGPKCPARYLGYNIPSAKIGKEYKFWNKNASRVRSIDPEKASEINKKINDWKTAFDSYISDCNLKNMPPDVTTFIASLDGTYKTNKRHAQSDTPTLISIFAQFLESIKTTHNSTTYRGYKVIKGKLQLFQETKNKTILVSQIDAAFYKDFSVYLMRDHENTNATISRRLGKITTVLTWAIKYLKLKSVNPEYKEVYKLKSKQSAKFPLRPEELATLRAYKTDNAYHAMVLDAFLLACETGLRHSDILQLQPSHIQTHITDAGLIKFIALTNIKTDNANNMPLSENAIKIVEKYSIEDKKLFRFHHSQAAGKVLKTLFDNEHADLNRPCEIIKMKGSQTIRETVPLYKIISFHMARNTYITRLLSSNIAPVHVQQNAGHSDLKITMGYFRNDDVTRWQETLKILNKETPIE